MTGQRFTDGETTYTVALDTDPPLGRRFWGVAQARLVDELTGLPVTTATRVAPHGAAFATSAAFASVAPRVAGGGVVGLAGTPAIAFPALNTQPYDVGLAIRAAGYVPVRVTQALGPQAIFPHDFTPAAFGDIALHREPVVLRGRTLRRMPTGELVAAPNATVHVTGIWRTMPPSNAVVPPLSPNLAAVVPPLYASRLNGADAVQVVTVTPVGGEDKETLTPSHAGAATIRVSDHVNLAVGDAILIDEGDAGLRELVTITALAGSSNPLQPVTVTLAFPLAVAHARGARVRRATLAPAGTSDLVGADAIPGDTTVLLASANTLGAPTVVALDGGGAATEYHWLAPYTVISDGDGYYRLPPISRVAQLTLEAELAPFAPEPRTICPNYAVREQIVDLVVT